MINKDEFIELYCHSPAGSSEYNRTVFLLDYINKEVKDGDLSKLLLDESFIRSLFYQCVKSNTESISYPHYARIKSFIRNLREYTNVRIKTPSHLEVLMEAGNLGLFEDLFEILDIIDVTGASYLTEYSVVEDLLPLKSLVILSWHGFQYDEILNLTISNLNKIDNKYFIIYNKIMIALTKMEYEILLRQCNSVHTRVLPNGRHVYFRAEDEENHIFKTINNFVNRHVRMLKEIITDFNTYSKHPIKTSLLNTNRLFVKLYESTYTYEGLNDKERIKELFKNASPNTLIGIRKLYMVWINKYHPNKQFLFK